MTQKTILKKSMYYISVFISVLALSVLAVTLTAAIPQRYIKANLAKSAEIYSSGNANIHAFGKGNENAKLDNRADQVLLSILYCQDSTQSLKSGICSRYYDKNNDNILADYKSLISGKAQPNTYYTRYWHGSMVFIKPLLVFTDINGIRAANALLLLALTALVLWQMIRAKEKLLGFSLLAGMFSVAVYTVPFCIEFMPAFAVMLLSTVVIISVVLKKEKYVGTVFLISGMAVCFFDFLTCETLSFTVPVCTALILSFKNGKIKDFKNGLIYIIKNGLLWFLGYAGMFLSKFGITALFIQKSAFSEAAKNASLRLSDVKIINLHGLGANRIFRNFVNLNLFDNAKTFGDLALRIFIVSAVVFSLLYLYKKKNAFKKELYSLLFIIMLIPYIRYAALNNHSFVHSFFTFRAQLVTIMLGLYMVLESIDKTAFKKDFKGFKKSRR